MESMDVRIAKKKGYQEGLVQGCETGHTKDMLVPVHIWQSWNKQGMLYKNIRL